MSHKEAPSFPDQSTDEKKAVILARIKKDFIADLAPLMKHCYEAADDGLFDKSERAGSNQEQTQFFHAMQTLRRKKEHISKAFFQGIKVAFKQFIDGSFQYFDPDDNDLELSTHELTLVEEQELDQMLAISNSISKAKTYLARPLFDLHKRFAVLASQPMDEMDEIPLSPTVLVHSFAQALKAQEDMHSDVFVVLIKAFERAIILRLLHVYDNLNQSLINEGVLPHLRLTVKNTSQPYRVHGHRPEQQTASSQQLAEQINQLAEHGFTEGSSFAEILLALENKQKELVGEAGDLGSNTMNMALGLLQLDLLKKLSDTNAKQDAGEPVLDPGKLKEGVLGKLKGLGDAASEGTIGQVDEVVIDMVSLLFQYVVEDKSVPQQIQALLLQLQVPYLNFAINDRSIFTNKEHVARQLLEKLAESSIGWNEQHDIKGNHRRYIKKVVEYLIKTDAKKINFQALLKHFENFQGQYKKRMQVTEKRALAKAMGMERLNLAKQKTAKIMQKYMSNRSMPKLVKTILLKDWVNVLTLEFLRNRDDADSIKAKIIFVKDLIQAVQRNQQHKTPAARQEELCRQLASELRNLSYSEADLKIKCSELADLLAMMNFDANDNSLFKLDEDDDLAPYKPDEAPTMSVEQIQSDINQAMNLQPVKEVAVKDDAHAKLAASMKLGTWVEFTSGDEAMRAKLSWISPITATRLFVNARGQKLCNISLPELAEGLRHDEIQVIESAPLFDRVLKSVAQHVNEDKATDQA